MNKKPLALGLVFLVLAATASYFSYVAGSEQRTTQSGGVNGLGNDVMHGEVTFAIHHVNPALDEALIYSGFDATGCGQSLRPVNFWSIGGLGYYMTSHLGAASPTCASGWTYSEDPAVTFINEGTDFMQAKLFGVAKSITLVTTDYADVLGLSASSNAIAQTDTYAGASGPCNSAAIWNGGDGFNAVAVTATAGTPASGSATNTETNQFSDITANVGAIRAACVLTETVGGAHPYEFAAITFGPDTFAVGDTVTTTYTWTVSG